MVKTLSLTEVRRNLPELVKYISDEGGKVVISVHGKRKVIMFDMDFYEEIKDNEAFGITPVKIQKSLKSKRLSLSELKKYVGD